jgi:hypothetical protein
MPNTQSHVGPTTDPSDPGSPTASGPGVVADPAVGRRRATLALAAPAVPLGPATSPGVLAAAALSGYAAVRERVAAHSNTPEHILVVLASDPEPAVRARAARNRRTPRSGS